MNQNLSRLQGVKQGGSDSWPARCPGHNDENSSLSITQTTEGKTLLKRFAGCETGAIVQAVGLKMKDLFPSNGEGGSYSRTRPLTVAELAAHKRLPESFLRETFKVRDGDRGVAIPYSNIDGSLFRERLRTALRAKDGSSWLPGNGQALYGADRLAGYRQVSIFLFWRRVSPTFGLAFTTACQWSAFPARMP
jgi:putative DNA primase/helicase